MSQETITSKTVRMILFAMLSCCPGVGMYAQKYLVKPTEISLPKVEFGNFAEANLKDNPFRWDPQYLQVLRNQKEMTIKQVPLRAIRLKGNDECTAPKVHLKCKINSESTSLVDILLEVGYSALEICYDRCMWDKSPIITPACKTTVGNSSGN